MGEETMKSASVSSVEQIQNDRQANRNLFSQFSGELQESGFNGITKKKIYVVQHVNCKEEIGKYPSPPDQHAVREDMIRHIAVCHGK